MDITPETIIAFIVITSPIWVAILLYYLYGREYTAKDVGYIQVYERYPPTPDKGPLFAQYITWGKVDFKWLIPAWFLSLYQKGYLKKEGNKYVYQEGKEPLTSDENFFLQLLKSYFPQGVKIEDIKSMVRKTAKPIVEYVKAWTKHKFEKEYIDFTGWKLFMGFVAVLFLGMFARPILMFVIALVALVVPILGVIALYVLQYWQYAALVGIALFLLLAFRDGARILGRWSREGRLLQLKWQAFERYLKEQTLTPDKKVDDVILWDKLLVYGTALGVADKVAKQTWSTSLTKLIKEVVG